MSSVSPYGADDAVSLAERIRRGEISAAEATEAAIAAIGKGNATLNAFTDVTTDRARRRAALIDAAVGRGEDPGPLAGAPFAVKNLVDLEGLTTRAGSRIKRDDPPATRDAVIVERLEAAGAVAAGALNMGELAYDFTGENEHEGDSCNPHDTSRMTGGSSGGSGAAVASGLVPITLGSDTNGSIRVPASWCGVYGLKPTYGRLPRTGTFPFVDSLDHVGPMARSVRDLAAAYDAMQGYDPGDPASVRRVPEPAIQHLDHDIADLRLATAGDYFVEGAGSEALTAVRTCADALSVTREITIAGAEEARAAAYVISNVEGAALHLDDMSVRLKDFGSAVRERLVAGTMVPGVAYVRAQRLRRAFAAHMAELFSEVDVILAPATPTSAARRGQTTIVVNGEEILLKPNIGVFTQPISFVGLPVVCVPVRSSGSMPIGVQIIAPAFREDLALRVANSLSRAGVTDAAIAAGGF